MNDYDYAIQRYHFHNLFSSKAFGHHFAFSYISTLYYIHGRSQNKNTGKCGKFSHFPIPVEIAQNAQFFLEKWSKSQMEGKGTEPKNTEFQN